MAAKKMTRPFSLIFIDYLKNISFSLLKDLKVDHAISMGHLHSSHLGPKIIGWYLSPTLGILCTGQ